MNLRLSPDQESALRQESQRSGRSQQQLIREALDRYLGVVTSGAMPGSVDDLISRGVLIPARVPYRRPRRRLTLPPGVTSLELLDREDRI